MLDFDNICYVHIICFEFQTRLQKEERGHLTYGQKSTKLNNENGSKNKDAVVRLRVSNLSICLDLVVLTGALVNSVEHLKKTGQIRRKNWLSTTTMETGDYQGSFFFKSNHVMELNMWLWDFLGHQMSPLVDKKRREVVKIG